MAAKIVKAYNMALSPGWNNHLLSPHSTVRKAIVEIRRLAVDGESLGGVGGQSLTPLSSDEWDAMRSHVEAIEAEMNALVDDLAPEEAAQERNSPAVSATRYHLLLALRILEQEEIDEIDPTHGSRYGALDPADEARLVQSTAAIRTITSGIRTELGSNS
jgi:hypothetical protein